MPVLRNRTVLEIARGIRAFLNLDVGLTRGQPSDFEQKFKQTQNRLKKQDRQLALLREQLSNENTDPESIRQQLADRDQEIARLRELNHWQAVDHDKKIAEIYRQLHETGQDRKVDKEAGHRTSSKDSTADLYLDLMKRCLTDAIYGEDRGRTPPPAPPSLAHTLIGPERLDNLQFCVEHALANEIPGDLIETGVWRGGATIFMRAILKAYGVEDRYVWVADSFEGFPPPNAEEYPHDAGDISYMSNEHAITLDRVKANFERYGLLDDQVRFLKGWFRDTLPTAPIEKLAIIRLDGDMYESTMDALVSLYPKLSVGGYLIVDDYGCFPACRQAVQDYRKSLGINEDIQSVDWTGVFWQRLE